MRVKAIIWVLLIVAACESASDDKLKIYGRKEVSPQGDTIYHKIADFAFLDQDSAMITNEDFKNSVYVADFFFTSCPTICPKMKTQLLRVYDEFEGRDDVKILSHSIDPTHDTVAVLREFASRLGVSSSKWHFITGDKRDIFKHGQTSYMVSASEDATEPGGYIHSGAFILVDKERRIRGYYDGTLPESVDKLIIDIRKLLNEYNQD